MVATGAIFGGATWRWVTPNQWGIGVSHGLYVDSTIDLNVVNGAVYLGSLNGLYRYNQYAFCLVCGKRL